MDSTALAAVAALLVCAILAAVAFLVAQKPAGKGDAPKEEEEDAARPPRENEVRLFGLFLHRITSLPFLPGRPCPKSECCKPDASRQEKEERRGCCVVDGCSSQRGL